MGAIELYYLLPFFLLLVVLAILGSKLQDLRRGRKLKAWARANDLEIVHRETRSFFKGPFFGRTPEGHDVVHVTVRDREGRTRRAFVRIGPVDPLEVRWVE